ncbi:hypothetical protein MPSEU_000632500 [Mayamaea pseudoterrestris]|nr:hypothetical protein MPSEU_000632500 [Mayamaea pseudoterrestris]
MKAPHLAQMFKIGPKRKSDEDKGDVEAKRLRRAAADADADAAETTNAYLLKDGEEDKKGELNNVNEVSVRAAIEEEDCCSTKELNSSVADPESWAPPNDDDNAGLSARVSSQTQQKISALSSLEEPNSADHRSFIESMLQQHARFVSEACKTFQSNPLAMQTAVRAHQQCLDSLLDLYYKIHTHDSSADRASRLFHENYNQLQKLHASVNQQSTAAADGPTKRAPSKPRLPLHSQNIKETFAEDDGKNGHDGFMPPDERPLSETGQTKRHERNKPPNIMTDSLSQANLMGSSTERQSLAYQTKAPTKDSISEAPDASSFMSGADGRLFSDKGRSRAQSKQSHPSHCGRSPVEACDKDMKLGLEVEEDCDIAVGSRKGKDSDVELASPVYSTFDASQRPNGTTTHEAAAVTANEEMISGDKENCPGLNKSLCTPSGNTSQHDVTEAADSGDWICIHCTLENSPSKRRCIVCHARRPVSTMTSLLGLPKRTPRGKTRLQDLRDASQGLFDNSQPSVVLELNHDDVTGEGAKGETRLNEDAAEQEFVAPPAAVPRTIDSHSKTLKSSNTTEPDFLDEPRRITLDAGVVGNSQGIADGEKNLSPSFDSQETEDPTMFSQSQSSIRPKKKEASDPPQSAQSPSAKARSDAITVPREATKPSTNPYAKPWQSNLQSRQFDRELITATADANHARTGPAKTVGPAPGWHTAHRRVAARREKDSTDIWNDSESQEPYHEVVRGKARKDLPTHDCPECTAFYNSLITTESQPMDIRQFCRHRSRFGPPPETPEGFWELDFIDELRAKQANEAKRAGNK